MWRGSRNSCTQSRLCCGRNPEPRAPERSVMGSKPALPLLPKETPLFYFCLTSRGFALSPRLSFQGCLHSDQLWKIWCFSPGEHLCACVPSCFMCTPTHHPFLERNIASCWSLCGHPWKIAWDKVKPLLARHAETWEIWRELSHAGVTYLVLICL